MFERRVSSEEQKDFWIPSGELPAATPDAFYRRVNATLEKLGFARKVWAICEPAYADASRGGRPGIDPVVYLKMLTVGFFEDLPSERAIANRCADSLSPGSGPADRHQSVAEGRNFSKAVQRLLGSRSFSEIRLAS